MIRRIGLIITITPFVAGILFVLVSVSLLAQPVQAQEDNTGAEEPAEEVGPTNAYCLLCHEDTDQVWHLPSGESLSLQIDPSILAASVHGTDNPDGALACADCHGDFRFPHPVATSRSIREFRIERYTTCRTCHEDQYTRSQDSVHGAALRNGQVDAAVCIDCHGGHDIQSPNEPRERISLTCGSCHGAIFNEYSNSVHGEALFSGQNADVPTCINCHGVHDIANPTTSLFRQRSPELCATCHSDSELMQQYDISTHVFDSYLTDFHGATVALFEQEAPNVITNKPVCYDCHGVHSIQAVGDDEAGLVAIRESLVETCRECHPNASDDFSDAWIGHYPATPDQNAGLYFVEVLYRVLTPVLAGLALVIVSLGLIRRINQTEPTHVNEGEE